MLLTDTETTQLDELVTLLDEAYRHYFATSDGYCKSSEGAIELELTNFFDRREGESLRVKSVMIYSYVLGPSRAHYFGSVQEALAAVRHWHAQEMARDDNDGEDNDELPARLVVAALRRGTVYRRD